MGEKNREIGVNILFQSVGGGGELLGYEPGGVARLEDLQTGESNWVTGRVWGRTTDVSGTSNTGKGEQSRKP